MMETMLGLFILALTWVLFEEPLRRYLESQKADDAAGSGGAPEDGDSHGKAEFAHRLGPVYLDDFHDPLDPEQHF